MLRFFVLSALAVTATGCTDLWLGVPTGPGTIAVGARAVYAFSGAQAYDCSRTPNSVCTPPASFGPTTVDAASAADPNILEVLGVGKNDPVQPDLLPTYPIPVAFVHGRSPGTTELTLSDGLESRWLTVRAVDPDRIEWDPLCSRRYDDPEPDTLWLPADIEWAFILRMWQGSTELAGYGLESTTDAGTLELVEAYGVNTGQIALYRTPDQPGPTELTTTTDTLSVTVPIEVFELSQLDELELITGDTGPYPANGDEVTIYRRLYAAGDMVCEDVSVPFVTIRWTNETPEICAFAGDLGESYDRESTAAAVRSFGNAGTCTVTAEALATGLTASIDLEMVVQE